MYISVNRVKVECSPLSVSYGAIQMMVIIINESDFLNYFME